MEIIKQKDEQGLLEAYEKHMILDPNMSEEAAKEKEARIQAEKKERVGSFLSGGQGNKETED